ncbi:MAG: alpha-glucosidase/alpha-galactosidase [Chloroflexi bacterium]|nr:MAG: alpha-glucosidase/alpha-galactosidase [Chloroflexota bacterium]
MVDLNIAYIGGGSRNWARTLMNDLATCPDLNGEVRLYDIDIEAARINERLASIIWAQPEVCSHWHFRTFESLPAALKGADLVIISIQPGSLEQMAHEIAVAEKYGLFYPVGDTTGAPGLMRGLRSVITYAGFAEAIAEYAPDAWVINYTNPMTICTRTLTRVAPQIKAFGCCHEVFGTQIILANLAQEILGLEDLPTRDEIHVNVLGINHFTWIDRAEYRGHDLVALLREYIQRPGILHTYTQEQVEAQSNWFYDPCQIKFTLFQRFGILAAAGDRHLAEFVPGFIRSPDELFRWGIIRTPVSWRMEVYKESARLVEDLLAGRETFALRITGEEAVRQIRSLFGLEDFITNINMENQGQITNLPLHSVVETNACFSRDRVQPLVAGSLPLSVHGLVMRHVANQEMIIEAALTRDKALAFQAVFNDPTVNLPIDRAWAMFNEIGFPDEW